MSWGGDTMHLVFSTEDLLLHKRPYPRFPILLDKEMRSVEPANEFMRYYLTRGRIGSEQSWPSTGRALYDYFSFLEAHGLEWTQPGLRGEQSLVSAYRDYCLSFNKLKRTTVRQRLLYVCEFYEYALKNNWINRLPFGYEDRAVKKGIGFLAHVSANRGKASVRDVTPTVVRSLPRFLSKLEIQALINAATNPHHRMIIRLGLQTGLRREELATFPLAYVADREVASRVDRNVRIRLDPDDGHRMQTKGSKPRDIFLSKAFYLDLHYYALHQRGERSQLNPAKYPNLFLNDRGQPFASSGKHIARIVREIGARAGLRVWTHMLRHTYATHTLNAMQGRSQKIEPLVFIQRQLGHESVNTTMVYLHLVNEIADAAILEYDDELNQILGD